MTQATTTLGEKLREAIEKKSLATTINQWDDEDSKQTLKDIPVIELPKQDSGNRFGVTTNASRVTFDFVLQHSGRVTALQVADALEARGQKRGTVTSLCYQMVKNGFFRRDKDGVLTALVNKYEPLKNSATLRNKARKEAEKAAGFSDAPKKKIVMINRRTGHTIETGGIAALKQETTTAAWSVDAVVDGLTLTQGRALYLKLKEIFGG